MRPVIGAFTLWACILGAAGPASANCLVIDTLDRIHAVQFILARNPDTPLFPSKIRLLRSQMHNLDNGVVLDAVDASALTAKGATFLRFTRNARRLLEQVSIDDPDSVRRHFEDPNVRTNLQSTREYLVDLRCTAAEIRIAELPESGGEDGIVRLWRDTMINIYNPIGIAFAVIGLVTLGVALLLIQKRQIRERRKSKRYATEYETAYRVGGRTSRTILHDISKTGLKLKHDPEDRLIVGSSIDVFLIDKWMLGLVVWSNDHFTGVAFKTPQDAGILQIARQKRHPIIKAAA